MIEYTVYDSRTGQEMCVSHQPDATAASENAAVREAGIPGQFALVEWREISDEAARRVVGMRGRPDVRF